MQSADSARKIDELAQIIRDYHQLAKDYENALRKFSKPVGKNFPKEGDVAGWRKRYNVLAVEKPFYGTFQQIVGTTPTPGQKFASEFVDRHNALWRNLEEYCIRHGSAHLLSLMPLSDVRAASGKEITVALQKHKGILLAEPDLSESRRFELRIVMEFAKVLREARTREGKTQEKAAAEIGVSVDTYKGWERGRHEPETGEKRLNAENFIRATARVAHQINGSSDQQAPAPDSPQSPRSTDAATREP